MQYLNFDLLIEPAPQGFHARVVNSPAGEADLLFTPPFTGVQLESFYSAIQEAVSAGEPERAGSRTPQIQTVKQYGAELFETVFREDVRVCLFNSIAEAGRQDRGLRIRLRLAGAPELAIQPWEYLYNPGTNRFFGLGTDTPLVRYLDLPERVQPLGVNPPFRVLAVIASPDDYPPVDADREWANLNQALEGLIKQELLILNRLDLATPEALQEILRRSEYHIFHFIGHGDFDEHAQDGHLILVDGTGSGRPVSGEMLGAALRNHRTLRLAVLNACEGARGGSGQPFAGVAQNLVQQGIPAVVAMQFPLPDVISITFAQEFYKSISDGLPVDASVAEARRLIYFQDHPFEWGAPVLFMRSPDGAIFNLRGTSVGEPAEPGERSATGQKHGKPKPEKNSSDVDLPRAGGDTIIAHIGSGASGVAVGKNIQQFFHTGRDTYAEDLEPYFQKIEEALHGSKAEVNPGIRSVADFQLNLLKSELSKTGPGDVPSASTITQVGDWLLENVPALRDPLEALFTSKAAFQVVSRSGETGVKWLEERFKGRD